MSPGKTNLIDVAQSRAFAALESYLKSDTDLQDAVSGFIQPVYDLYTEKLPTESQLADALDALWTALLNEVVSIAYNDTKQGCLATFVNEIKSLPPPDQPAPQIWSLKLWSDLPILGATMRQRWNSGPGISFVSIIYRNADSKVDTENYSWLNLNAFAARLTASHVLDLSLYAIWAMHDALETPLEDMKAEVRDQTLRAAALWIEFCGEHLHGMEKIWESDPRKGDVARGGPLYPGPKGFCKERWELWRERLDVLCREERLEGKTRQVLAGAASMMTILPSS